MNIPYDHLTSLSTSSHSSAIICEPSNPLCMTFAVQFVEQSPRKSFFKKKELFNVFIGIPCRFFDKSYNSLLYPYSQLQTYSSSGIYSNIVQCFTSLIVTSLDIIQTSVFLAQKYEKVTFRKNLICKFPTTV